MRPWIAAVAVVLLAIVAAALLGTQADVAGPGERPDRADDRPGLRRYLSSGSISEVGGIWVEGTVSDARGLVEGARVRLFTEEPSPPPSEKAAPDDRFFESGCTAGASEGSPIEFPLCDREGPPLSCTMDSEGDGEDEIADVEGRRPIVEARTDAAGVFRVLVPPGVVWLVADDSSGHVEQKLTLAASQRVDLTLAEFLVLKGHLRDDAGKGISGALAVARAGELFLSQTTTDADGAFELRHPRGSRFEVFAASDGRTTSLWGMSDSDERLELEIATARTLRGKVHGAREPSPPVTVCVSGPNFASRVLAAADGTFEAPARAAGEWRVAAWSDGARADQVVQVKPAQKSVELELRLRPAARVSGTVNSGDGAPIAGAELRLSNLDDSDAAECEAQSDRAGRFRCSAVFPGRIEVEASAEGFVDATETATVTPEGALDLTLTMTRQLPITGRVVDMSGAALTDASIRASRLDHTGDHSYARSDDKGRFTVEVDGPGEYMLAVELDGYLPAKGQASAPGMSPDIVLTPGAELSGTVVDPNGARVAHARVRIETDETITDGLGRFSLSGFSADQHLILASSTGPGPCLHAGLLTAPARGVVVRLAELPRITGVVIDGRGKPVAGVTVTGYGTKDGTYSSYDLQLLRERRTHPHYVHEGLTVVEGVTGADGRFELRDLWPRLYNLWSRSDAPGGLEGKAQAMAGDLGVVLRLTPAPAETAAEDDP